MSDEGLCFFPTSCASVFSGGCGVIFVHFAAADSHLQWLIVFDVGRILADYLGYLFLSSHNQYSQEPPSAAIPVLSRSAKGHPGARIFSNI